MLDPWTFIYLSIASAAMALAIKKLAGYSKFVSTSPKWGARLLKCPFCIGFWTALITCYLSLPKTEPRVVVVFAIYGGSILVMGIMLRLWLWLDDENAYLRKQLREIVEKLQESE